MDIIEAIQSRRSIRRFKPDPVPREILEQLLTLSRWSPSGSNTQPWELAILEGKVLDEVKARIVKDMKTVPAHPDIPYPPMPEPYRSRQREIGRMTNAARTSEEKAADSSAGGRFFDAPSAIIVSVDKEISPRAFLGLGMWAQTVCLGALNYGLGTCIMSMAVYWPEVYRELLSIPASKIIAFGIAIGYPDVDAKINNFERTREPLEANARWYGL